MKLNRAASLFVSIALLASVVVGYSTTASAAGNPNCNDVDGDYIVSFAPGVSVDKEIKSAPGRAISAKFKYDKVINGFAATLSAEQVCAFQKRPNIENIELDGFVSIETEQSPATWGLDRIDTNTATTINSSYSYTSTGSGVTAYVIDTGISSSNPNDDFTGRFAGPVNYTSDTSPYDCNGHGTHVAGTIGGTIYGVAKNVSIVAVKVLNCSGSGSTSGVIAGLNYVKANASKPAVANMSLGGSISKTLDTAVKNLVISGVTVVVAAGNDGKSACNSSPARVAEAITVAASDRNDKFAFWSNYGSCVDVIAPGVSITSDWPADVPLDSKVPTVFGTINTISGTSMASPHVAGAVARFLSLNSTATPSIVAKEITSTATTLKVTSVPTGTPNRLLFVDPKK